MKQLIVTRKWTVVVALAIMVGALRLMQADECTTFPWGCSNATVRIWPVPHANNEAQWSQADCPPGATTSPNVEDLPVMTSTCDRFEGLATAQAANITFSVIDGVCVEVDNAVEGSVTIDPGRTGCESTKKRTGCGIWEFAIFNPKRSGIVTVTATVTGDCLTCPPDPPNDPCNGDCAIVAHTWTAVGYVQVDLPDDDDPPPPPPPGSPPGPCGSCGPKERSLGSGSAGNDSVNFRLNLGRATPIRDAGYLSLYAETPPINLAQPAALTVPFERPGVEVLLTNSTIIQQVKSPQGLVHVVVKDAYEYQLQCFDETALAKDGGGNYILDDNGYYTTNAAAFTTWVVKNPDGATATNRLWITEQNDTERVFQYTYTNLNYRWDLVLPDGQTTNSTWKVADVDSTITNYFREVRYNGTLIQKSQKTYKYVAALADKVLIQEIDGDGTATRTNTYTYYSSGASGGNANKLQRVDYSGGNWEYYDYDDAGRCITNYSGYGNNPPPPTPNEPVPLSDICRVTEYAYTLDPTDDGQYDDGIISPWSPRRTISKLPASGELREVSRTYHYFPSKEQDEIQQCSEPGGRWGDAGNLYTINYRYYNTVDFREGLPYSISRPDGTATLYNYPDQYTTVEQRGGPDYWAYPSSITNGIETTTVVDELGLVLSRTNKAIVDSVADIVVGQETYNYLDPLRRSYDLVGLNGRTNSYRYNDCCGYDYTINADGQTNKFDYDVLKRQVASTLFYGGSTGIKTTNVLDAVGRVLETRRIGTDGTTITNAAFQYNVLGHAIYQTNALGGVTTYTNVIADNRLCTTNTYADGGTRIEIYFRDGSLDRIIGTVVQPVRYEYGVESEGGVYRSYTKEIKLDGSFADTSEWTKTYTDMLGRGYKTIYASASGTPTSQSFYNDYGQLWKQVDPDSVTNLFGYNSKGEREFTAVDLDDNEQIDTGGIDRVTQTISDVVTNSALLANVRRTRTYVWGANNDSTATLVSTTETSTNGLKTWNTVWNNGAGATNKTQTVYSTGGNRYVTNTAPDGSYTISAFSNGRLTSITRRDSGNNQILKTTYGYDAHGRQSTVTDARNGTTSYTFNNADQIATVTTPAPGNGQGPQTTTTYYDTLGRSVGQSLPDSTTTTNLYYVTGLPKTGSGSRQYPVGYSYDAQGRMKTMTNWSNFAGNSGARVTTWNYDAYRGFLSSKTYDGNVAGPSYTYTAAGRLATRTWARGTNTAYSYNNAGDLSTVTYNDSTPGVTCTFDRRGRQATVVYNGTTTTLAYNDANQLLVETNSGGTLGGLALTNAYDSLLRRSAVALNTQPSTLNQFGYDNAARLSTVTNGLSVATYTYLANSPLASQIVFKTNGTTRMTTTKNYDYLNRLQQISSAPSASGVSPVTFSYAYNNANQRIRRTESDASYWVYQYDSLGQVTSGQKYWSDGTPVPGQQFEYGFDDIGNRTSTRAGGDSTGSSSALRTASYTANTLNQYTSRDVPNAFDVLGASHATNSVTINGSAADYRRGEYFQKLLTVVNNSTSVWQIVTVTNTGGGSTTGSVFIAKSPETFLYDADGNLTNDGRWTLTWDAENRLTQVESLSSGPTAAKRKVVWEYDGKGRRIRQTSYDGSSGSYAVTNDNKFLFDGWNCLAELDATNNALIRSYAWGLDMSGSMQGAGGVGGLLMLNSTANGMHFYAYDGNGNVAALVKASDGTVSANYEYDPFGQTLRATGAMAKENGFRFSSKYQDDESDLLYYGYRYYIASTGRWLNRDPIEEMSGYGMGVSNDSESRYEEFISRGFEEKLARTVAESPPTPNKYVFVQNSPTTTYDILGLCVPLPNSGPGQLTVRSRHWWDRSSPPSTLTFTVCCPALNPYLAMFGVTASPCSPWTPNRHPFPTGWSTVSVTPSPPCYTIVISVPSRTVAFFKDDTKVVRIEGSCCCTPIIGPTRTDSSTPNPCGHELTWPRQ